MGRNNKDIEARKRDVLGSFEGGLAQRRHLTEQSGAKMSVTCQVMPSPNRINRTMKIRKPMIHAATISPSVRECFLIRREGIERSSERRIICFQRGPTPPIFLKLALQGHSGWSARRIVKGCLRVSPGPCISTAHTLAPKGEGAFADLPR